MPVYDYVCRGCDHEFQVVQRMSEHAEATVKCPECKSADVERVITGAYVRTRRKS